MLRVIKEEAWSGIRNKKQLSPEGEVNNSGLLYRDTKHWGMYLALWTDPERASCFSIYQISWIKIKKELFVNKRRHFVRVSLCFNWQCFGIIFLRFFLQIQWENFFYQPVNTNKPNFVSLLVFVGTAASFTAKISAFKTVEKQEAILNLIPKRWISKDILSYRSQSEREKIAIHWFGDY